MENEPQFTLPLFADFLLAVITAEGEDLVLWEFYHSMYLIIRVPEFSDIKGSSGSHDLE